MTTIYTKRNRPATRLRRFTKPSLTQPDQTMSLKTMVTKYVRGLPISAPSLNGIYTDDDVAEDFEKLDFAEQEERLFNASDELSNLKGKITKQKEDEAAEAKKKAENQAKELEDLRKKVETLQPKTN